MSRFPLRALLILLPALLLNACGGGGTSGTTNPTSSGYRITGSVSGLTSGQSLTLYDKLNGDSLAVSNNGTFAFGTSMATGANYAVTISQQPTGQQCFVTDGLGIVGTGDVTSIVVSCTTPYTIGGTVTWASGTAAAFTLIDNSSDRLSVPSTATKFIFSKPLSSGQSYNVAVAAQPGGAVCQVANGSGTVGSSNVSNVNVTCSASSSPEYVYVGTQGDHSISAFKVGSASGVLNALGIAVTTGTYPVTMTADPKALHLYVVNGNSNTDTLTSYAIDGTTGGLGTGATVPTGSDPYGVAVTPDDAYVYVVNNNDDDITELKWVSGTLQPNGTISSGGVNPQGLVMGPGGKSLYALNFGSDTLTTFAIAADGTLSAVGVPVPTGVNPYIGQTALTPGGEFLYVVNYGSSSVSGYSLASNGQPSPLAGSPFAAGANPFSLAVNPAGTFAYVVNDGDDTLSTFSIDPTYGTLTAVGTPVATASAPQGVAVDPSGRYLYVANNSSGTISQYSIDQSTGLPSAITGTVPSGLNGPRPLVIVRP